MEIGFLLCFFNVRVWDSLGFEDYEVLIRFTWWGFVLKESSSASFVIAAFFPFFFWRS